MARSLSNERTWASPVSSKRCSSTGTKDGEKGSPFGDVDEAKRSSYASVGEDRVLRRKTGIEVGIMKTVMRDVDDEGLH